MYIQASIVLHSCTSAANRGNGIHVQYSIKLRILQSSIYSNSRLGVYTQDVSTIMCEDTTISGNGAGFRISRRINGKSRIMFDQVKISGHHYGPGIWLEDDVDTEIKVIESQLHDNYQGGFKSTGHFEGTMEFSATNFTRNRGPTLLIDSFFKGMILIDNCIFHQNQLNDYMPSESVLQIVTESEEDGEAVAMISDCAFTKNIMNDVIVFKKKMGAEPNVTLEGNELRANLARNVVCFNSPGVIVKKNFFNNAQSYCEIKTTSPSFFDSGLNYWGYSLQAEIRQRICATSTLEIVTARNVDETQETNPSVVKNPLPKVEGAYTRVPALPTPYTVESDIVLTADQTLVVEPGAQLLFDPNVGIIVQERAKLVMNGSSEGPIQLASSGTGAWRGVTVKPGGSLFMSHVTLTEPSIGLWLDSDRFYLDNVVVKRPNVHGVEVTANAGEDVDLGGTVILDSVATSLAVEERNQNITIRDFRIENAGISGIDFAAPSGHIAIEDGVIVESGTHGIHLSEFPQSPLYSITIRNVTLKDQKTGHAGLLISGVWIGQIDIEKMHAEGNSVPAVMLALECNDKPSMTRIYDSSFVDNRDTVLSLQLGECGGLQLEKNYFDRNNADGRAGVVRVDSEPNPGLDTLPVEITNNDFSASGGDFVLFLSTDGQHKIDGKVIRNRLNDNAVSQAAVIVASPSFVLKDNRFENPKTKYQLEPRGDGTWVLNATNNWWGTEDPNLIQAAVKAPDGAVRLQPFQLSTEMTTSILKELTTTPPTVIRPVAEFEPCAHINYCSYRGECIGSICQCPPGFSGPDCSILTGCNNNCSKNGICNAANICYCYEGWTGTDCGQPLCAFNCGGHGECVSKDECKCDEQWTGEFCLEPACSAENCKNGRCEDKQCICEGPWRGKRCDVPVCTNCSLNGVCVAPESCKCFADWGGNSCNQCVGTSCSACDLDCDHGICIEVTRTCSCAKGWKGAACDICETTGGCSSTGRISTIQPQTADREDINTIITVFGSELPKTPNNHYACIFGMLTTVGLRQSSSIIRCPMPANLTAGRHLFNLAAGPNVLTTQDGKPVHFTVYDSCKQYQCQGSCIGPLCICPKGKAGLNCELVEPIPEIDRHFLTNQQANIAVEGKPYVVVLPTMPGTVLRFNSTIPELRLDAAKGYLEWPDPIGQETPHNITVTAYSVAGESTLSWNVSVKPSYTAMVDEVTAVGNTLLFKGHVNGTQVKQMPVTLKVRSADGTRMEELTTTTDDNGSFVYAYIPVKPGEYFVSASHPGEEATDQQEFKIIAETPPTVQENGDHITIHAAGEKNCSAIPLPGRAAVISQEHRESGTSLTVTPHVNDEFFVLMQCQNGKELIRIEPVAGHGASASTSPQHLILYQDPIGRISNPLEIMFSPGGTTISSEVQIHSDRELNIISTQPSSNDYDSINRIGLTVTFQMDIFTIGNGTIVLVSNKEALVTIPYAVLPSNILQSMGVKLSVCLRDEFYGKQKPDDKIVASLSFTNAQLGLGRVEQTQFNVVINGEAAIFNLAEGYYQLTVDSPLHDPFSKFVQVSQHNDSFCLTLSSSSPVVASTNNGNWTSTLINKPHGKLPFLEFSPAVVLDGVHSDVLVTVKGDAPGILSVENGRSFNSRVQSVQSNNSFWSTASFQILESLDEQCTAVLMPVKFDFLAESSTLPVKYSSNLVVGRKDRNEQRQLLCDENGRPAASGTVTKILCSCGEGAKANCRAKYRSATACGASWSRIPDDTVSLHVLSTFLLLISDCQDVHVQFDDLEDVLRCVSGLEKECPVVLGRRKREIEDYPTPSTLIVEQMQADGPASIINQLSSIQAMNIPMQPSLLKFLNAIDMQSPKVSLLYQDFFSALKKVFPYDIPAGDKMQNFIAAIGEKSEGGMGISEAEAQKIGDDELLNLWNDTVDVWTSGKMNSSVGIQHEDAKRLVAAADRLKSFARQNVANDPFAVLHDYLGKLLETPSSASQECAQATVLLEPKAIYDGDTIKIRVFLTNTKNQPMTASVLDFDILRADSLAPEALVVASGLGVNPNIGVLSPGESLETKWLKRIVPQTALTSTVKYQPVITLSFSVGGRLTKQRLEVPVIELHPARSAKIVHFIYPRLSNDAPFSVATSIMNIGYSYLDRVKVHSYEMVAKSNGELVPYKLKGVQVDRKQIDNALTFDIGSIPSGESRMITMNITTDSNTAKINSVKCPISVDDQLINVQEMSTYIVEATAGSNGLMVKDATGANYFFRPDTGSLVNIVPLIFIANRSTELPSPRRKVVIATFRNDESRSFTGFLWGSLPHPEVSEGYKLVKVTEKANGKRDREVRPIAWKETTTEGEKLNFVDSGYTATPYTMTYEFVFANPEEFSVPRFDQSSYRIQLVPDIWWPSPPNMVGQVAAESDDGEQVIYSLYSPDNSRRFSVDNRTGSIVVEEPLNQGKEYCLVMVARDARGQESRVPVAINTGGPRQDCYLFNTEGLTPMVSHWDVLSTAHPTSSGHFTASTLPTREPPTGRPTTTTDEIDIPTPPTLEPLTDETEGTAATHTISTDSHVSDFTTVTTQPITEPSTESTGHTVIVVPTAPWTTDEVPSPPTIEPITQSTEFITPDHTLVTLVSTEATVTVPTDPTTESLSNSSVTQSEWTTGTVEPTESRSSPSTIGMTSEIIYTITPDRTPATFTTSPPSSSAPSTVTMPSEDTGSPPTVTIEVTSSSTSTDNGWTVSEPVTGVTVPIHSITPDNSPKTATPTAETVTPWRQTTATVEPPVTVVTANTIGGNSGRPTATTTEETGTTDEYADACRKTSIPVFNLICELSKTVVRRGG